MSGIAWMIAAALMAALSGGMIRQLAGAYSALELVFLRCAIGLVLLAPWVVRRRGANILRPWRMRMYMLRSALSYAGSVCLFFALGAMPIAEVYALQFTTPLFTILLAMVLLRERAGAGAWVACLVGFIGAVVIIRPGFVEVSAAALAALVTAVCYASANICIKSLSRTESPVRITIFNNVLMLGMALGPALYVWVTPAWRDVPWIFAMALFTVLGGLFHARAVSAADARVVQPFSFMRLVWSVVVGYLMFAEFPGLWTWAGATIIFASSYYILYVETGRRRTGGRRDGPT